jgi:cytochrome c oxidase subunit II
MSLHMPLLPEQASSFSGPVDQLACFIIAVSVFLTALACAAILYFVIRYRRRSELELPKPTHAGWPLQTACAVIPFALTMVMFGWGANIFFDESRPPRDALQVYVVAKQWMWKLQHIEGQREINELHIPVGRSVKLSMTSEDVIHSFYVPAFRTRQDIVPGRYSTTWFRATKPGKYRIFCTEYCGTNHSGMTGWVYAMEPKDYEQWLAGGPKGTMVEEGKKLFEDLACIRCHKFDGSGRCPALRGLFGQTVLLTGGATVEADEAYIRESILDPAAKVVDGYQPFMPVFKGLVTEEQVIDLIAYIKTLVRKPQEGPADQTP